MSQLTLQLEPPSAVRHIRPGVLPLPAAKQRLVDGQLIATKEIPVPPTACGALQLVPSTVLTNVPLAATAKQVVVVGQLTLT
jgi:hypothetical protein